MIDIIETYKKLVVQIATPFSTGTGFIMSNFGLIITNEHVVRDNKNVTIQLDDDERHLVKVLYLDQKHDIAFLQCPISNDYPELPIAMKATLGEDVIALGHPLGLPFAVTKGVISSLSYEIAQIPYLLHDAALNPGNSGGPLINTQGELCGINSFIMKNGVNIGLSLPALLFAPLINEYKLYYGLLATRCVSCDALLVEKSKIEKYCSNCGHTISSISMIEEYEPTGMNKKIEDILLNMQILPDICRRGPHSWVIINGSAEITITYHEKSGYIMLDAYLAKLAKDNIEALYKYLLQQNYYNQGITFGLKNQNITLSLMIYDQYLNFEVAKKLFTKIFKAADHYDDILVNTFGAKWVNLSRD